MSKMWKPGTEKPEALNKKEFHKKEENGNKSNTGSSTPRKKLSGATMNMRFMQRNKAQKQQRQPQRQTQQQHQHKEKKQEEGNISTPKKQPQNDMELDQCESDSKHQQQHTSSLQQQQQEQQDDEDVDMESPGTSNNGTIIATASDMYGMQSDLVGRRSFGGFNRAMEHAWKSSHRVLTGGSVQDNKSKQHISDDELLKRYKDLVDNRGRGEGDDHGRSRQRNQRNSRSQSYSPPKSSNRRGEKRKRTSISDI